MTFPLDDGVLRNLHSGNVLDHLLEVGLADAREEWNFAENVDPPAFALLVDLKHSLVVLIGRDVDEVSSLDGFVGAHSGSAFRHRLESKSSARLESAQIDESWLKQLSSALDHVAILQDAVLIKDKGLGFFDTKAVTKSLHLRYLLLFLDCVDVDIILTLHFSSLLSDESSVFLRAGAVDGRLHLNAVLETSHFTGLHSLLKQLLNCIESASLLKRVNGLVSHISQGRFEGLQQLINLPLVLFLLRTRLSDSDVVADEGLLLDSISQRHLSSWYVLLVEDVLQHDPCLVLPLLSSTHGADLLGCESLQLLVSIQSLLVVVLFAIYLLYFRFGKDSDVEGIGTLHLEASLEHDVHATRLRSSLAMLTNRFPWLLLHVDAVLGQDLPLGFIDLLTLDFEWESLENGSHQLHLLVGLAFQRSAQASHDGSQAFEATRHQLALHVQLEDPLSLLLQVFVACWQLHSLNVKELVDDAGNLDDVRHPLLRFFLINTTVVDVFEHGQALLETPLSIV